MFIKTGANNMAHAGFIDAIVGMLTNRLLFTGYALYGLNTVLLALALRDSELSLLYPIIALTFVWVALLSVVLLHESLNPYKLAGITTIVIGVGILGRGKM